MISALYLLEHANQSNNESLSRLIGECGRRNVPVQNTHETRLPGEFIAVAGGTSVDIVLQTLQRLRGDGRKLVYALDSFRGHDQRGLADRLEKERFHFKQTEAIIYLLNVQEHFVYAYPKADVAASIVVVFRDTNRILLIRRKRNPFGGMLALPGGFLRPLIEDLPECAVRELHEETGLCLSASMLTPLSVRSDPARDTRGHVIDHGFMALLSGEQERLALLQLRAADDAEEILLLPVDLALNEALAADHNHIIEDALKRVPFRPQLIRWIRSLLPSGRTGRSAAKAS